MRGRAADSSRPCVPYSPTAHPPDTEPRSEPVTITTTHADQIAVLNLGNDENRFSLGFLDEIDGRLDEIVAGGAHGLVTTGTGKFYSNGLDLDWLLAHGDQMQFYV